MPTPTRTRIATTIPTNTRATSRSRATSQESYQARRAGLRAVFADELEQTVEIERFLEESLRVDARRPAGVERRQDDDRDILDCGIGLLESPKFPDVHD